MEELAFAEGRGPDPATKDTARSDGVAGHGWAVGRLSLRPWMGRGGFCRRHNDSYPSVNQLTYGIQYCR
jgi:hypothetical protein